MAAFLRRRGCLVALVLPLLVIVAGGLLVRRALDPESLRQMAETRLTQALGQPVTIGTMAPSFLPPAVEARDISLGAPARSQASPGVSLRSLRIKPRLSSLFSSPIVIEKVEVVGLALAVRRDRDGRWTLPIPSPSAERAEGAAGGAGVAVDVHEIVLEDGRATVTSEPQAPGDRATAATVRDITATVRTSGGEVTIDSMRAALGSSSLAGSGRIGREGMTFSLAWTSLSRKDLPEVFALIGAAAPEALSIEGEKPLTLDVTVDRAGALAASGRISAGRASLDTLALTGLEAPVRLANGQLALDPVTFSAYGGRQRGRISADVAAVPVAWTLESDADGVDMNQLVSANSTAKGAIDGTGTVRARLRGRAADPVLRTIAGTVTTVVANGAIHDFPVLAAVNAALKIGAGDDKDLRFDTLSATWHVADGRATTSDFLARSGELTLAAWGTLGFDQSLDFRGRLAFSEEKSAELVRRVRELARLRNQAGEIDVPLTVTGTVASPAITVDARALVGKAAEEELKRRIRKGLERFIK